MVLHSVLNNWLFNQFLLATLSCEFINIVSVRGTVHWVCYHLSEWTYWLKGSWPFYGESKQAIREGVKRVKEGLKIRNGRSRKEITIERWLCTIRWSYKSWGVFYIFRDQIWGLPYHFLQKEHCKKWLRTFEKSLQLSVHCRVTKTAPSIAELEPQVNIWWSNMDLIYSGSYRATTAGSLTFWKGSTSDISIDTFF